MESLQSVDQHGAVGLVEDIAAYFDSVIGTGPRDELVMPSVRSWQRDGCRSGGARIRALFEVIGP